VDSYLESSVRNLARAFPRAFGELVRSRILIEAASLGLTKEIRDFYRYNIKPDDFDMMQKYDIHIEKAHAV
jgi:hypothetical protein